MRSGYNLSARPIPISSMSLRLPSRKTLTLTLAGIAVTYLLFAWLALPRIIQTQAEKFVAGKAGHHLVMNRPEINPFTNTMRLTGLRLLRPDGKPLLAFRELIVDLSIASVFRRAFVFDGIRLDGLETTVELHQGGRNNWSVLIDAAKNKEPSANASLPRIDIHHFELAGARLDFADQRITPAFATRIEPMNLELNEISTLPNDKGRYVISARTVFGARISWQGEATLDPLAMTGNFSIKNVDLARLATYFREMLPIAPPAGIAGVSANYQFGYADGKADLILKNMAAKITGLRLHGKQGSGPAVAIDAIEAKEGSYDLAKDTLALGMLSLGGGRLDLQPGESDELDALELENLDLEDTRVDLAAQQVTLGRIVFKDGRARIKRDAQRRIDILQAMQSVSLPPPAKPETEIEPSRAVTEPDWRYRVEKLELSGFSLGFRDESVAPAADLALEDIAVSMTGISDDWTVPVPLRSSFKSRDGGNFEAEGNLVPAAPAADIRVKLTALALAPAQPYLSAVANLKLAQGQISSEGHAKYGAKGASYNGNFALRDLRLVEADTGNSFLSWKSLGSRAFTVTPKRLDIGKLTLAGLDTKLVIYKDKSVSIKRVLRQSATDAESKPAAAQALTAAAETAPPFVVDIDRLRVGRSSLDFADYSLALPFGTRIHDLHGVVTGLSSRPGSSGQLELDGQVDDYGLARAAGQIDLFNPTDFMDLKVVFRNIEMTRLTPYSATFAGRRINSGKLSLDLEYKIKQRQLQGENQVVMNQLTLGERVESPQATNLPLDFAIAILQDSDGRIDLGLPVSGSLDDPQFSYGRIIWKAIVSVLTKIVTAPFRALGALFGSDEKFDNIAFEAGAAQLTPPEREKLVRLAGILAKRPGLSLALQGTYAETDRVALQDLDLRRAVATQSGQPVDVDTDPGPISTRQPKVQAALEKLYSKRFGSDELASLKQGFRQANPGQLEESTVGKVISRLSGLFRKARTLNAQELSQLKGADFHAILFERLRNAIAVGDERLQALATARGKIAASALKDAGVPAQRLELLTAEKINSERLEVPLILTLRAAASLHAPAPAEVISD